MKILRNSPQRAITSRDTDVRRHTLAEDPSAMGKNTISKALPTIALRDHVGPDTPLSERPAVPKSRAASKNWNLRARLPFDRDQS